MKNGLPDTITNFSAKLPAPSPLLEPQWMMGKVIDSLENLGVVRTDTDAVLGVDSASLGIKPEFVPDETVVVSGTEYALLWV